MLFEAKSEPLEEHWCDEFRRCGAPEAILACTFTFNAEFFADILDRFTDSIVVDGGEGRFSFRRVPVDVVCDRAKYRGHKVGYNVAFWKNNARLFHPKLFIALFPDEVVWSDGSLNLTKHGWRSNREVAMLHRPGTLQLPKAVRELLLALPENAAAKLICSRTRNAPLKSLSGTCVSSLSGPIGPQYIAATPRYADEVHLVAPFFDMTKESSDSAIDLKWLNQLALRYPDAEYHIYLPQLIEEPLTVQGDRLMFQLVQKRLSDKIVFHAVSPQPGPLHGKIVNIVYRESRTDRACMLVGSPNLTHAALLAPTTKGNIELAWIVDRAWKDVKPFFKAIQSKRLFIDDIEFKKPKISANKSWHPLKSAIYDPLQRILKLEWHQPEEAKKTIIRYAGKRVVAQNNQILSFNLVEGICYVTLQNTQDKAVGYFPIEIPVEDLTACSFKMTERTPDDWLQLLGVLTGDIIQCHSGNQYRKPDKIIDSIEFVWSSRVRDLAARMRYVQNILTYSANDIDDQWNTKLLNQIYLSHDPSGTKILAEQVWRVWVRLELWRLAAMLSRESLSSIKRLKWHDISQKWKYNLGIKWLSSPIQKQVRVARKALVESAQ